MTVPAFDDPREFLADFGVSVEFVLAGGTGAVIKAGADGLPLIGLFDEKYQDAKLGDFDMATSPGTRLKCVVDDVAGVRKHDSATVGGVAYYLDHDPMPDGYGFAVMALSRDTGEV